MTYKGIAKGKTIELEQSLPYKEGQPVTVSIEPVTAEPAPGSPAAILKAIHSLPHVDEDTITELQRVIKEGRLPASAGNLFDSDD